MKLSKNYPYSQFLNVFVDDNFVDLPSYCGNIFTVSEGCTTIYWINQSDLFRPSSKLDCLIRCLEGSYVAALYLNDYSGNLFLATFLSKISLPLDTEVLFLMTSFY